MIENRPKYVFHAVHNAIFSLFGYQAFMFYLIFEDVQGQHSIKILSDRGSALRVCKVFQFLRVQDFANL